MKPSDIETWTRSVISRVEKGQPVEDARVELKREWPDDPADMARRIAGHANAARGAPILWVIGVDQKGKAVPGVPDSDTAQWWPQVQRWFDGVAPRLVDLAVPHDSVTVVALLFETDRAPFVVKNPAGGKIGFEVPWREATSIRSARRDDLVGRTLGPKRRVGVLVIAAGSLLAICVGGGLVAFTRGHPSTLGRVDAGADAVIVDSTAVVPPVVVPPPLPSSNPSPSTSSAPEPACGRAPRHEFGVDAIRVATVRNEAAARQIELSLRTLLGRKGPDWVKQIEVGTVASFRGKPAVVLLLTEVSPDLKEPMCEWLTRCHVASGLTRCSLRSEKPVGIAEGTPPTPDAAGSP